MPCKRLLYDIYQLLNRGNPEKKTRTLVSSSNSKVLKGYCIISIDCLPGKIAHNFNLGIGRPLYTNYLMDG